ncbi:MAG TPA: hypothetical protein VFB06_37505 [Streptosporangiaceae bacterium]|nr:hypothetical protein [Streptosporangiaceae bacterium]
MEAEVPGDPNAAARSPVSSGSRSAPSRNARQQVELAKRIAIWGGHQGPEGRRGPPDLTCRRRDRTDREGGGPCRTPFFSGTYWDDHA